MTCVLVFHRKAPHLRLPGGTAAVVAAGAATLLGVAVALPSGVIPLLAMAAAVAAGLGTTRKGTPEGTRR